MWVWTTAWVDDDCRELNNTRFELWNSVVFFSGVLGFALLWAIPIYRSAWSCFLLAYFVPLFTYMYVREPDRARRPEGPHALPPGRGHQRADAQDRHEAALQQGRRHGGPGRDRRSSSSARARAAKDDPTRVQPGRGVAVVHVRQGAGLRRRAAPGDRHPPRADQRAAFGPLPDRRHPPRRRAVRPADRRRGDQRLQGPLGDGHLREAQAAGRLLRRQA